METKLVKHAIKDAICDTLIVGATRSGKHQEQKGLTLFPATREVDQLLDGLIIDILTNGEFKGNLGETTQIYTMGKLAARRVIIVGMGPLEQLQSSTFRQASGIAVRFAQNKGARQVALALDGGTGTAEVLQAVVEGAMLAVYEFKKYQSTQANSKIETIAFLSQESEKAEQQEALRRGLVMAEAANFARDLVNEQPSILTPGELANRASTMARKFDLECTILERPQMEALGMGGLLAVAKGSTEPPRLIILRYRGAPEKADREMALVGKGVTFDSGGLSLKTAQGMETMKGDMAGGAAVIGAMQAIALLKPAINVTALVPATENMPDGASYHPGDILRLMNGKTIEIVNTDAEGRLILADALSYAVQQGCSPIVDIATLTGGSHAALGGKRASLFCNTTELRDSLMSAGDITGEKLWPLPLDSDYLELIESSIADVKQTGGRVGGAITAAKVLEHFVGEKEWAHLDIAGMESGEARRGFQAPGATGFGTRLLVTLVLKIAEGLN